jgi:hypothetical protein
MGRPKKQKTLLSKNDSNQSNEETQNITKTKSLFYHINQIREVKNPKYFNTLTVADIKSFNKYTLLMGLSMDQIIIEEIAFVSKYFDILAEKDLYKVLCDFVPHGRRFCKWIKPNKVKFNKELIQLVSNKFEVSKDDAYSYCVLFFRTESGINSLIDICKQYGKSDKEIEGLMENE